VIFWNPVSVSNNKMAVKSLDDATNVAGTATFRGGAAFDPATGAAYVCPYPAGGAAVQTVYFVGGMAVRGDGAQIIDTTGPAVTTVGGVGVLANGAVFASTIAAVHHVQNRISLSSADEVCIEAV
jgi:DNA-binding beta-propeller fold protein YncE